MKISPDNFLTDSSRLTIRAEFAARAMQGLLSNGIANHWSYSPVRQEEIVKEAVEFADLLIEALNK